MEIQNPTLHRGSCHCGALKFEAEIDATRGGRCNCTVCTKISGTSAMAKPGSFKLLTSEADLGTYVWGGKISTRYFCKHCGIHAFGHGHLAELGGDYTMVNLNCIDDIDQGQLELTYWDGRHDNWEGGPRSTPWPISP